MAGQNADEKTRPVRIQLSRKKGWRMPPNTVKVTRPGRWGNPFRVAGAYTAAQAVADFKAQLLSDPRKVDDAIAHLRGKNLACWCALDQPCHADVLLKVANAAAS
jgi:hypothetical protein